MVQGFVDAPINIRTEVGHGECGDIVKVSGSTPATIPGSVFDSGRTRRLTGKSSTSFAALCAPPTNHQCAGRGDHR